jgi:hypothetical protein
MGSGVGFALGDEVGDWAGDALGVEVALGLCVALGVGEVASPPVASHAPSPRVIAAAATATRENLTTRSVPRGSKRRRSNRRS